MLTFSMKTFVNLNLDNDDYTYNDNLPFYHTKWNESKKENFVNNLQDNDTVIKLNKLSEKLININKKETLDVVLTEFSDVITTAGVEHIHKLSSNSNNKQGNFWYDEDCRIEKIKFLKRKQIFDLNDNEFNRKEMCKQRGKYRRICRQKRKKYNIKQANDLLVLSKKDPKKYWRHLKGGKRGDNINAKLNFLDHFKNLASKESSLNETGEQEVADLLERELKCIDLIDNEISLDELNTAIKSLKRDKSCGNDGIVNEFIINAPLYVKDFLLLLFNAILSFEYVPDKWCIGTIIPIFKSGDKGEVNNYRGITLLSIVCKLFTKIMNSRLNLWAENEKILTESQFGFRQQRGTTDCLFILHGLIEKLLVQGKKMYAAFIDYEKAFDYLDRGAIWAKLIKNGVSSKCIRMFQSLYEKMKLEVRQGSQNDTFTSSTGILQRECTSPIFFSFFVNDLEESLIFSDSEEGLQDALDQLDLYCSKWGIKVNVKKN